MSDGTPGDGAVTRLTTVKGDAEIAADLKRRARGGAGAAAGDHGRGVQARLLLQFDGIRPEPPYYKHRAYGLRIAKHY